MSDPMRLIWTAVMTLLVGRRPSTILWRVRTVIVDTIKHEARRARAHVSHKCVEVVDPAITDRDAAPAPVPIPWMVGVQASSFHVAPRIIFSGRVRTTLVSVFRRASDYLRVLVASTTDNSAVLQMARGYGFNDAAVTFADPVPIAAPSIFWRENDVATKRLTGGDRLVFHCIGV